jgi:hypothetical protein
VAAGRAGALQLVAELGRAQLGEAPVGEAVRRHLVPAPHHLQQVVPPLEAATAEHEEGSHGAEAVEHVEIVARERVGPVVDGQRQAAPGRGPAHHQHAAGQERAGSGTQEAPAQRIGRARRIDDFMRLHQPFLCDCVIRYAAAPFSSCAWICRMASAWWRHT